MPLAKNLVGSRNHEDFQTPLPETILVSPEKLMKKRTDNTSSEVRRRKDPRYARHGWYSDAKKMEVACTYAVSGNSRRVSELTGVKEGTIRAWKQTEWWHEIQQRIRQDQNDELDAKLTKLVNKAVEGINDRLESGDYVYNAKADKLIRKPVNAKDLAVVAAITVDKRQLLRGEPTSRTEKVSENEKLVRLAEEFKKFALAKEINSVAQEIEDENAFQEQEASEMDVQEQAGNGEGMDEEDTEHQDSTEEGEEEGEEITLTVDEMFSE